ncbi:MAG TPA: PKD domain-containing protein [Dehalococcoidia bacterium]|nr:PKD domain-containing protein [Dehalococcoidia bacterium]
MRKLRKLAVVFLVVALLSIGVVPLVTEAQIPPALYRCTVYNCDVPVGAGVLVEAYVGAGVTPRATGLTDGSSVCILEVSVTQPEVDSSEAISFKVTANHWAASETPEVDVTLEAPEVRLDICITQPVAEAGGPYSGYEGDVINLYGSASLGVPPYSYAWDLDYDGLFDDSTDQNPTYSWGTAGDYTVELKVTDNAAQEDTDTADVHIDPECELDFPHGLTQDTAAIFPRYYDCLTVSLPTLTEPTQLIVVWYYDEVAQSWEWFRPGWPESILTSLENGEIYLIIVQNACTWTIPQI